MNSLDAPLTLFSLAEGRSPLKRTLSILNCAYSGPRKELVNVHRSTPTLPQLCLGHDDMKIAQIAPEFFGGGIKLMYLIW
jgi:hypothetical protein